MIASAPVTASGSGGSKEQPTTPVIPVKNPTVGALAASTAGATTSASDGGGVGKGGKSTNPHSQSHAAIGQPVAVASNESTETTPTAAAVLEEVPNKLALIGRC